MFEIIESKSIFEKSTGIRINIVGRFNLMYRQGERVLLLPCNDLGDSNGVVTQILFPQWVKWQYPYASEVVNQEDREKVKRAIVDALSVHSPNVRVEFAGE